VYTLPAQDLSRQIAQNSGCFGNETFWRVKDWLLSGQALDLVTREIMRGAEDTYSLPCRMRSVLSLTSTTNCGFHPYASEGCSEYTSAGSVGCRRGIPYHCLILSVETETPRKSWSSCPCLSVVARLEGGAGHGVVLNEGKATSSGMGRRRIRTDTGGPRQFA